MSLGSKRYIINGTFFKSKRPALALDRIGILITGCSHSGKSTLAKALAEQLGFTTAHTDQLARHPGRPWPKPKPAVVEYYQSLSAKTLFWLLQAHYENLQFKVDDVIHQLVSQGMPFIFEGSALRPLQLAAHAAPRLRKICLTASDAKLRARIQANCGWERLDNAEKTVVEAFIERRLMDRKDLIETAQQNDFETYDLEDEGSLAQLVNTLARMQ